MIHITELDFRTTKLFLSSAPGRVDYYSKPNWIPSSFGANNKNISSRADLYKKPVPEIPEIESDIRRMINLGVETVVVLLEKEELFEYPVNLLKEYREAGLGVIHFPIEDYWVPEDLDKFDELLKKISSSITFKKNILIHCRAGMGRTGLVVAALLIKLGTSADKAIAYIRKKRPGTVESKMQETFLHDFEKRQRYGK